MTSERGPEDGSASGRGLIHTDLASSRDEAPRAPDGRRLQHGAGQSRPLRPAQAEPQPRGAKVHGGKPIDQNEAAARFIAAPEHEKKHDERLWDLRRKHDGQAEAIFEWEELRELASRIKQHTLSRLDTYLEQFEANARARGSWQ